MPGCFRNPNRPQLDNNDDTKKKKSGGVRFCERVQVFEVMTRSEYTKREMKRCFFSHEYQDRMNMWITAVGLGKIRIDDTRGLESFLSEDDDEMFHLREMHMDSVMDEQDRQDEEEIEDDIAIAAACRRTSAKGAIMAYIAAKKDERAAFDAYMKMHHSSDDDDYSLMCGVAPSPTSMDKATVRSYFAASDIDTLSVNLLVTTTPAA